LRQIAIVDTEGNLPPVLLTPAVPAAKFATGDIGTGGAP